MLALFEVLSFKGWLDVRDVLIKAVGPVLIPPFIYQISFIKLRVKLSRFMRYTFTSIFSWVA